MPETRVTSFPASSVNRRVRISLSASETNNRFYLSQLTRFALIQPHVYSGFSCLVYVLFLALLVK